MNERTRFFIKIYLSHFIWKGWCFLCVRGELETDCYILSQSSSRDHSSTSSLSWLGCSTLGRWGPKPAVWSWFSLRGHPISNCDWNWLPSRLWHLVIWLFDAHLLPVGYASAPNSTTSTGQGDIPTSSTGCICLAILLLIYTGASLDWRLSRGPICNTSPLRCNLLRLQCTCCTILTTSGRPHGSPLMSVSVTFVTAFFISSIVS